MPENKQNSVSLRVPEWVLEELESRIMLMARPRPSRGELITRAWTAFKEADENLTAGTSTAAPGTLPTHDGLPELSKDVLEIVHQIKSEHIPWVRKLLKVLNSGKEEFENAVQSNLNVFADYCDVPVDKNGPHSTEGSKSKRSGRSRGNRKAG
jgi:hypothetical protein